VNKEIVLITGSRGSGKTTAAMTFARPSEAKKIVYIDTEGSGIDLIKKIKASGQEIGEYVSLYDRLQIKDDLLGQIVAGKLPWVTKEQSSALTKYYLYFIERMDKVLVKNKYKYLILDTVEPVEAGMAAWSESHRAESGWSGQRDHGKLEIQAVRPIYEALLESFALRGIEYVILTSHLRGVWLNDKPVPSKVEPGGRLALLSRIASVMMWMVPNVGNASGAPAAIILKARRAQVEVVDDEWVVKRPLPQRIPDFSWTNFRKYEKNGCDHAHPAPGESITPAEMDMISEYLSDAQLKLMTLGAEAELEQMKAQQMPSMSGEFSLEGSNGTGGVSEEVAAQIVKLSLEGLKPMQIKTQLGVSIKDVVDTLKGAGG
jgi:hypothetical protein